MIINCHTEPTYIYKIYFVICEENCTSYTIYLWWCIYNDYIFPQHFPPKIQTFSILSQIAFVALCIFIYTNYRFHCVF